MYVQSGNLTTRKRSGGRRNSRARLGAHYGPNAIAQAAQAILASLPPGSGVNPITPSMNAQRETIIDTQWGGTRSVPYYTVHPILDPSGLIQWTGSDSAEVVGGLDEPHILAANALISGDTSAFADYNPANEIQAAKLVSTAPVSTTPVSSTYTVAPYEMDQYGKRIEDDRTMDTAQYFPGGIITESVALDAVDAIRRAGGDSSQPIAIVPEGSSRPVGYVRGAGDGILIDPIPASRNKLEDFINTVTGIGRKVTDFGQTIQHAGNAVEGAVAGAKTGYARPLNLTPWLIGGGLLVAATLLGRKR